MFSKLGLFSSLFFRWTCVPQLQGGCLRTCLILLTP